MVSLGRTAVCRAVGRGQARCSGDAVCAKRHERREAHKAGRTRMAPTLAVAGWVLRITTRQAQFPREG